MQSLFLLWLKSHSAHYTSAQITTYPLGVQAVAIVSNILAALHIDATQRRAPVGLAACALQLVSTVLLLIPSTPAPGVFVAFYLAGTSYMVNPLLFGWANVILKRSGDEAARSVLLYWMNAVQSALYTFWGIALYPADEAPYWRKGGVAMCVVIGVLAGMLWVVEWVSFFFFFFLDLLCGWGCPDQKLSVRLRLDANVWMGNSLTKSLLPSSSSWGRRMRKIRGSLLFR